MSQTFAVARFGGPGDGRMERFALHPVAEHRIDPLALLGRGVEVEFAGQVAVAVDRRQPAHRPEVTAQGACPALAADAEHRCAVARAVNRPAPVVAAKARFAQPAREAVWVFEGLEILAEGVQKESER